MCSVANSLWQRTRGLITSLSGSSFSLVILLWDQQLNYGGMQLTEPWGRSTVRGSSAVILYGETWNGFLVMVIWERCSLGAPHARSYSLVRMTFVSGAKAPPGSVHVSSIWFWLPALIASPFAAAELFCQAASLPVFWVSKPTLRSQIPLFTFARIHPAFRT